MNDLGIALAWSAVQATALALATAAVYPFAARRPAAGAAVAAAGLGGAVLLTVLALCPLPAWWGWPAPEARPPQTPAAAPSAAAPATVDETGTTVAAGDPAWPAGLVRWTWDGAGHAAAPFRDHSESRWGIGALVLLVGVALCLLRFGGGLWAVAVLRRRSRPILDEPACRLMRQLQEEMDCRFCPELREAPGLGIPAAAGWLRPVVLLPAGWRDWTEPELRAALAHELAHVRRSDYLIGLLARLGIALHFYHPLLHWLAGRLRLQQELAADALAARFVGGRDAYLRGLARLALRLDDRRPAGWPANPLLSRGTLMRRIRMLKTKDGVFIRPAPSWGRGLAVALLAAAVVGAAAVRCPAQKAGAPPVCAVAFVDGGTVGDKDAAAPEPFELPCLPPDAMGVVCFRPSAVLGRPGMKKYADDANKEMAAACKAIQLPRAFGPPVEEIAQVSMTVRIKTDKNAKVGQTALTLGSPMLIRATKDFDWAAEIKALLPNVKEERHDDHVVYQLATDGPLAHMLGSQKICCYAPDGRTIVFDTEEHIGRQVERPAAAPAWAADFKRVERGIAAVVLDNRDGAWARELSARDKPEPEVAPFLDHTPWVVLGTSADDGVTCETVARFDGEETAAKAAKAIDGWLSAARTQLAAFPDDASHSLLKSLVEKPGLKREGASIRVRCHAEGDAAEWLRGILDEGIGL